MEKNFFAYRKVKDSNGKEWLVTITEGKSRRGNVCYYVNKSSCSPDCSWSVSYIPVKFGLSLDKAISLFKHYCFED